MSAVPVCMKCKAVQMSDVKASRLGCLLQLLHREPCQQHVVHKLHAARHAVLLRGLTLRDVALVTASPWEESLQSKMFC